MNNLFAADILGKEDCPGLDQAEALRAQKKSGRLGEYLEFFSAFLRRPGAVGAVAPSSPELGQALINQCDLRNGVTIVELGSGTGAVTRQILERISRKATFFGLELDSENSRRLQRRHPHVPIYNDSAEFIPKYLQMHAKERTDYIISSLPWSVMPPEVQDRIFKAILATLKPSGMFTTYAYLHSRYLPSGRHFLGLLKRHFRQVQISPIIWRNIPPAFVYRCRQPSPNGVAAAKRK